MLSVALLHCSLYSAEAYFIFTCWEFWSQTDIILSSPAGHQSQVVKGAAAKRKKKKKGAPEQRVPGECKAVPLGDTGSLEYSKREHEDSIHWLPSPKKEPQKTWMCIKLDACASSQQFMVSK